MAHKAADALRAIHQKNRGWPARKKSLRCSDEIISAIFILSINQNTIVEQYLIHHPTNNPMHPEWLTKLSTVP
jgi:hypothetical protein